MKLLTPVSLGTFTGIDRAQRETSEELLKASEGDNGASSAWQHGTEAAGYGLNPLQSLADTQSRAPSLLPVLKDLTASSPRSTSFLPRASSTRGQALASSTPSLPDPQGTVPQTPKQRNPTELLTSQRFFFFPRGSWQILSFASRPSWTKLLQRIPPAPLPLRNAIPREKWFHGDPLLSCI